MRPVRAVAAGIIAVALLSGCEGSPSTPPEAGYPSFLYVRGTTLFRHELASGRAIELGTFPAPDVYASSSGTRLAYVVDEAGSGRTDFAASPQLHIVDLSGRRDLSKGPGVAPLWDARGNRLAYLRPVSERLCEGEECAGLVEVRMWDGENDRAVLEPGRWTLLAWAGSRLLVGDAGDPSVTWSVTAEDRTRLDVPPNTIWDGTPDGRALVTVAGGVIAAVPLDRAGAPVGAAAPMGRGRLAEASWDGAGRAVAILIDPSGRTRLAVVDPASGTIKAVPGTFGATGRPLWVGHKRAVVSRPETRGRLVAELCPLDEKGCRPLFSWRRGVVLLTGDPGTFR